MKTIRSLHKLYRCISLVLALHFINISVDPKDYHPNYIAEDLSINEIESIMEFVAEVILGFDNTFKEHDDHDSDGTSLSHYKCFLTNPSLTKESPLSLFQPILFFTSNSSEVDKLTQKITSPPPKA